MTNFGPNNPASPNTATTPEHAVSPLRARFQGAAFALFGVLGLVIAVRYLAGDSASLLFILLAGAVVSGLAWIRTARKSNSQTSHGENPDGGLYIGFLLGAVVAASLLLAGRPGDWVLSGLLISVALFLVAMARFEASTLGLTAALSLATIAAFVGAAQLSTWVSWTFLSLSTMLVAAGLAVSSDERART